jgi:hypothetical protein
MGEKENACTGFLGGSFKGRDKDLSFDIMLILK